MSATSVRSAFISLLRLRLTETSISSRQVHPRRDRRLLLPQRRQPTRLRVPQESSVQAFGLRQRRRPLEPLLPRRGYQTLLHRCEGWAVVRSYLRSPVRVGGLQLQRSRGQVLGGRRPQLWRQEAWRLFG